MNPRISGLTLVEILVAVVILSVIVIATSSLFGNSLQTSRTAVSSSQLQQTLRNAALVIGDEVQRATYIFPPQGSAFSTKDSGTVTVNWAEFTLGAGNKKTGPHEPNDGKWVVPTIPSNTTPPFLAMITAPIRPDVSCLVSDTGILSEDSNKNISRGDGCYKFVAYYPVFRGKVTRGMLSNSTTSNELLDENAQQTGTWVIMEFRMNLTEQTGTVPWNRVGCQNRATVYPGAVPGTACLVPPTIDPIRASSDLPVLTCFVSCDIADGLPLLVDVTAFRAKMLSTISWINSKAVNVDPQILVEDIDSSFANGGPGFVIRTGDSVDPRGIFQVRLMLRGKVNNITYGNQGSPISFYFVPRNIAPLKAVSVAN